MPDNKKRIIIDVLIILAVGLISFNWFKGSFFYSYGDVIFPFSPITAFKDSFYIWSGWFTGHEDVQILSYIPYYALLALWDWLRLPLYAIHQFVYYFLFTVSGLSVYYLILTIFKDERRHLMGLIAAFFYMFNSFTLIIVWGLS